MPLSDTSSLSSALSTDNEEPISNPVRGGNLDHYFQNASTASPPTKKKRQASPPHESVLADNPDIAFIVMFRSRFSDAFPKSLQHYGPQDIERGVVDSVPGENVERLLCALLGLVLNRKKDIERGHFHRALEEAVHAHSSQWPTIWQGKNPLHGANNFTKMSPVERLTLLRTLIIWSLGSSEIISTIVKESYKQQRQNDDLNQPLSVQPWGRDGDKRRYWLVEGQDDTHFRLYRESNPVLKHNTWRSVAGTIDELKEVADRLGEEGTQASRRLRDQIILGIPRFEASEDKRKRRDYRLSRRAQFTRPEPGFSLYEGRTRGKRIRYTFSDEEGEVSDARSARRSNRQSGLSTPAEATGPTFTASGRQIRSRHGGAYGETMLSGKITNGKTATTIGLDGNNDLDDMEDESEASSSGAGWDSGGDDDVDNNIMDDEDQEDAEMSDDETSNAEIEVGGDPIRKRSLVISLKVPKKAAQPNNNLMDSAKLQEKYIQTIPQSLHDGDITNRASVGLAAANSIQHTRNGVKAEGHPFVQEASSHQCPSSKMISQLTRNGIQPAPISQPAPVPDAKQHTQNTEIVE